MIVKRIGILSLAKILAIIYGFFGLIVGLILSFIAFIGTVIGSNFYHSAPQVIGIVFGLGAIIILPVMYGLFGFIGGAITGAVYNLIARLVGGLEIELEEKPPSSM